MKAIISLILIATFLFIGDLSAQISQPWTKISEDGDLTVFINQKYSGKTQEGIPTVMLRYVFEDGRDITRGTPLTYFSRVDIVAMRSSERLYQIQDTTLYDKNGTDITPLPKHPSTKWSEIKADYPLMKVLQYLEQ